MAKENIENYRTNFSKEKNLLKELNSLVNSIGTSKSAAEKTMIVSQMKKVEESLLNMNDDSINFLKNTGFIKKLDSKNKLLESKQEKFELTNEMIEVGKKEQKEIVEKGNELELLTLSRLKKEKQIKKENVDFLKPSFYVKHSNKFFSDLSGKFIEEGSFKFLEKSLIKSNIQMTALGYVSIIFFTTFVSFVISMVLFIFLLFFNVQTTYPFITGITETIGMRILKIFWIVMVIPLITFFSIFFYPSLEKKSIARKIEHEMPFATIHMAAIAGSMIEPTKIFEIIISTGEYPYLEKEFTKLLNQINVYGYNLAFALRSVASNSPSIKLAEVFNGIATTITSGGDLAQFFDQKSKSLLFEYRLEREKETKTSETFMDIYVSVVIAAPMILMLLVMMIKISGIGIGISTSILGLLFVMGVTMINLAFLTFLHIKQSSE